MTTANHALTATLLAVTIKQPAIVVPLALLSHYALDTLPHFGIHDTISSAKRRFYIHLRVELVGIVGLLALLSTGVYGWNLALLASTVAVLPDIVWPVRYIFYARLHKTPPETITALWHKKIQWRERPWGAFVEIAYFILGFIVLEHLIR